MENREDKQLLRDREAIPNEGLFGAILPEEVVEAYLSLQAIAAASDCTMEWRYYNDGKAWLCKIVHKKKTVSWLSVWEGHLKIGFYFTEKKLLGVLALPIDPSLKEALENAPRIGKLIPLTLHIRNAFDLQPYKIVAAYKKNLK
ncbi:MAG: DUF3788 family protein [Bacteroidales bacterium]